MPINKKHIILTNTLASALLLTSCKGALSDEKLQARFYPDKANPTIETTITTDVTTIAESPDAIVINGTDTSEAETSASEEVVETTEVIETTEATETTALMVEETLPTEPPEPVYKIIGDEEGSLQIQFTNQLGVVIDDIRVRPNLQWGYDENLLLDGDVVYARQTAVIGFTPPNDNSQPYDIRFATTDGNVYVIHDIDLTTWISGDILITDGTCHAEYQSTESDSVISNYDYEVAFARQSSSSSSGSSGGSSSPDGGCIGSGGLTY